MVYALAYRLGLPAWSAAALAVAATLAATGCLHEDGLADTADGFGGGKTREQKLDIMRDSRTGTYGVCALALSILLRASALASLDDPGLVAAALIAAHCAARAAMPVLMFFVAPARSDGLSPTSAQPQGARAAIAAALGLVALLAGLGIAHAVAAVIVLAIVIALMARLSIKQIGGQTGDVLGAVEQVERDRHSAGRGALMSSLRGAKRAKVQRLEAASQRSVTGSCSADSNTARRRARCSAISAGAMASHRLTAATAAVAAQAIEENASAKVATREETWRRRNWLRLAWLRNQSWIAVADAAAMTMPLAVTSACQGEATASATTSGAKTSAMMPSTASILARRIKRAGDRRGGDEVGRVLAGDGQPGEAAGELARPPSPAPARAS